MDNNAPSILKPTVIGGVSAAIVSSIPIVNCLNVLCCSLVIAGGFFAGYLYSRDCAGAGCAFGPGNGATVGLVAGLFYALTDFLINGLVRSLGLAPDLEEVMDQMDQAGLPPEYADQFVWAMEKFGGGFSILGFLLSLLVAAVFCTIGGLIAGMTFKVAPAPPAPPMDAMAPPPPPPPHDPAGPGGGTPPPPTGS